MKPILIKDVINAVEGKLIGGDSILDKCIINVSTDTRTITQGQLFVPLKGDNFDGHKFLDTAFENGAICALSQENIETKKPLILVDDTLKALARLAKYYLSLFRIPVVAVTGSTGKTTTKELIFSVINQGFKALKTEGNFNNEIGLPLTVFRLDDSIEAVVLEMGMSHFDEIHRLSEIACPDIAVITNIGVSHIENLGSRDGILKAKCEIFDFIKPNGIKILNYDDDKLLTLKGKDEGINYFSINNINAQYYAENIFETALENISCRINTPKGFFDVTIPLPGLHMVSNALAAAAVGEALGLSLEQIKKGIEEFKSAKMRMDIIKTDKFKVINDVYNANPNSVKAGIDVLASADGRRVCILGDMLELGEKSLQLHLETGRYAAQKKIDVIISIGEMAEFLHKGALEENTVKCFYFKTQEDFFEKANELLNINDTILVKASRGMRFEKTIEKLVSLK